MHEICKQVISKCGLHGLSLVKKHGSPGALDAVTAAAIGLGHCVTLAFCTHQPLSHQLGAPQFQFAGGTGLFNPQVHAVTVGKVQNRTERQMCAMVIQGVCC